MHLFLSPETDSIRLLFFQVQTYLSFGN